MAAVGLVDHDLEPSIGRSVAPPLCWRWFADQGYLEDMRRVFLVIAALSSCLPDIQIIQPGDGGAGGGISGEVDGGVGGSSGGIAGGGAAGGGGSAAGGEAGGGTSGGTAGGLAGGTAGGLAGGTAGGLAGGTAGGLAGGTAGGLAGGTAGGLAGGAPDGGGDGGLRDAGCHLSLNFNDGDGGAWDLATGSGLALPVVEQGALALRIRSGVRGRVFVRGCEGQEVAASFNLELANASAGVGFVFQAQDTPATGLSALISTNLDAGPIGLWRERDGGVGPVASGSGGAGVGRFRTRIVVRPDGFTQMKLWRSVDPEPTNWVEQQDPLPFSGTRLGFSVFSSQGPAAPAVIIDDLEISAR
jgi:hypothetical protein